MRTKQRIVMKVFVFISLCAMFIWLASPALAQEDPTLNTETQYSADTIQSDLGPDENDMETFDQGGFGGNYQDFWVGATQFYPRDDTPLRYQTFYYWYQASGGSRQYEAQITLPAGARIMGIRAFWYDNSASNMDVRMWKQYYDWATQTPQVVAVSPVMVSGAGGYGTTWVNSNYLTQVREGNLRNIYTFVLNMPSDINVRFRGCRIYWKREVNSSLPNPFTDIGHLNARFQNGIKALAASGITQGCGGTNFCPDNPITRGQMAVFLSEALGLHWHTYSGN
jgi:hypothetical protein